MKKKLIKLLSVAILFTIVINIYNVVNADFYTDAQNWFGSGKSDIIGENSTIKTLVNDISNYVEIIGTAIILVATIVLGIRYIFSSAEGKSLAKENIVSLLVACILFFGWSNIQNILFTGTDFVLYRGTSSLNGAIGNAFSIFKFLAQIVALIGILYVGIKYIFAGAEGKAELKSKSVGLIIGIILAFSAVEFLDFVSTTINNTI